MPIRYLEHLTPIPGRIKVLWGVNPRFHGLYPGIGQVAYALLTRAPVAIKVLLPHAAPRLACVKPVASVHPEPGSNSSLLILFIPFAQNLYLFIVVLTVCQYSYYVSCTTCWYVMLSKNSFRFLLANVGAKIITFIFNFQILSKLFSKVFCFII